MSWLHWLWVLPLAVVVGAALGYYLSKRFDDSN